MSIIFNGNTYTFGATVSANPGTGTTSYVFGGLSSGWTYGFIIWAFNGVGPSSIVGPITKVTLSEAPGEIRSNIYVFQGNIGPSGPQESYSYFQSPNPNNWMSDSINLSLNWSAINMPNKITGFTLPNGYTHGHAYINLTTAFKRLDTTIQDPRLETGRTYIYSYYHDYSNGLTLGGIIMTTSTGTNSARIAQILPVTGPAQLVNSGSGYSITTPAGLTGWQRFAFTFYTLVDPGGQLGILHYPGTGFNGATFYFGAPQLELVG